MYFVPSAALGVGSSPIFAALANVGRGVAFGDRERFVRPLPASIDTGVGNKPHPVAPVGRTDGTSRNNKRLDGISLTLKTSADFFKGKPFSCSYKVILSEQHSSACHFSLLAGLYHASDSINVLANDPSGLYLPNCPKHLRPEVAVIVRSLSSSGERERLAWEAAREDCNFSPPRGEVCFSDVVITFRIWVMVFEYAAAKRVNLAVEQVLPPRPVGGDFRAADAAEKRGVSEPAHIFSFVVP